MPLRDHFHAPLRDRRHWEGFHSDWASSLLRYLNPRLPAGYFAEPRARLGAMIEVDVATIEEERLTATEKGGNGVATAVWAPPKPTRTFLTDLPAQDTFEVRVYDEKRGARLVAAVELVSPANKDRPDHRRAFALKCAGYLQQAVALVVVDIVTERHQDLYAELLEILELEDAGSKPAKSPLYAVAYRTTKENGQWQLDTWSERLALGSPLPTMPLWLASDLVVPLELEASYEATCEVLRIQ